MVISKWSFTVVHYDRPVDLSNSWVAQDLTSDIIAIPNFTDTGDGSVNSAILKLNADYGHYIRDAGNNETGFPTKIDIHDRIGITMLDGYGGYYNRFFDVTKKTPAKDSRNGTTLQLTLTGTEHWLQKVNYSKRTFALTARELFQDLIDVYNNTKTAQMPQITIGTNELPPIYPPVDWGTNEDSIYNRLMELVDSMGASAANGGVLDYFEVRFSFGSATNMTINVFSSGNPNNNKPDVTINGTDATLQTDGGVSSSLGSLINAWGALDAGSLPTNYSKWTAKRLLMPSNTNSLYPVWQSDYKYKTGSIVSYKTSQHFETWKRTGGDVTALPAQIPPSTNAWTKLTTAAYYGNVIVYSPWTKGDNHIYWKNSGGDPSAGGYSRFGPCMIDGNLIINDKDTKRTWVDFIATNSNFSLTPKDWFYGKNASGVYEGLRVLVRGTGSNNFSGFTNHIMEYRDGVWKSKYAPTDKLWVAVIDTAKTYKYDGTQLVAERWVDQSEGDNRLDCFHPMDGGTTTSSTSALTDPDNPAVNLGQYAENKDSGVSASYTWEPLAAWVQSFVDAEENYYKAGAWLTLRFPLPINTFNFAPNTRNLGEAYGGTSTTKEPTTVDIQNMTLTHDGKRGFNQGDSSEDFGPISSIDFFMKLKFEGYYVDLVFPSIQEWQVIDAGNFQMRCVVTDLNDHVAYQDFTIGFNDTYESISLPISGFQSIRNFKPRAFDIQDFFPPESVDVSTQFEWRHLKMISFQTQESYDEFGRYLAGNGRFGVTTHYVNGAPVTPLNMSEFKLTLTIDAFRFTKPLLVNSGQITSESSDLPLIIEPDFLQRPDIFVYDQLKADVLAEKDRALHPPEEFVISTDGKFDVSMGDYFLFTDTETVDKTDNNTNNTIKLVAKHIEYSVTKPIDGAGGFIRTIRGVRRFE